MAKTMRMLFLIMVTVGLSMEFYAVVVCKSALLAQIHTENLIISCLIIGGWQLVCLAAGNYIGILLNIYRFTTAHHAMNALLSIVIFLLIAVHMAKSAWKNEVFWKSGSTISSFCRLRCYRFILDYIRFSPEWRCR